MIRKVAFVLLVFYLLYADAYFTSQAVRDRFWAIAGGGIYERGRVYDEPPGSRRVGCSRCHSYPNSDNDNSIYQEVVEKLLYDNPRAPVRSTECELLFFFYALLCLRSRLYFPPFYPSQLHYVSSNVTHYSHVPLAHAQHLKQAPLRLYILT